MSSANPFDLMKAAFEAVGIGVSEPEAEISFRQGCTRMGFYRQNFNTALKRQQHTDALGKSTVGTRLPQPHRNGDAMLFYVCEVEAYVAATRGE